MDTRQVARELRSQHWAGVIQERRDSGLSIRAWCGEQGINEKAYYYWQRKQREETCKNLSQQQETAMVPTFAEVKLPTSKSTGNSAITVRIAGAEVEIDHDATPEIIEIVLRLLRAPC